MNIRDEIRSVIIEVFSEAYPSIHFNDRVRERLVSYLYTRPSFNYSNIENEIDIIKKINFNPKYSYAIKLKSFPVTYISKDPKTGTPSIGNEIWAVVRDNFITTIFFRNSNQKNIPVKNVDNILSFKTLIKYYDSNEKNKDGTVDFVGKSKYNATGKSRRKKVDLDLPVVEINGKKWYIDEQNEELIYAKNIKKKLSFDDLKEEIYEKVIDAVTI